MQPQMTIIVTGAAGNLGAAVEVALASRGARLVLVDRTQEGLTALAEKLPTGTDVLTLPGVDLSDPIAADHMVKSATARFGQVTGLVNTIGGFAMGSILTDALKQFDLMMQLNARIPLVTSAAILPVLQAANYGRIVHIAAGPGLKAPAMMGAYAASKAAVMRLVESLAEEHAKDHITANCILPGTIDTPQNRAAMPDADTSSWVTPAAIAELIAFLVSKEGGIVTGAAIPASGPV